MKIPVLLMLACLAGAAHAQASVDGLPQSSSRPPHALPVAPYDASLVAAPVAPIAVAATGASASLPARWNVLTQDITLEHTLQRWAALAGYRMKWDAQRNFLIGAPDSVEGTFEIALQTVLGSAGIRESDYPLEACIYANTPPLVRVTRQGEQARECAAP